jgi:hypothetical protein
VPIGQTAGRQDGFGNGTVSAGKKTIYVYPLRKDCQALLCEEPKRVLQVRQTEPDAHWIETEFGAVDWYDERLKGRLFTLAEDFFAQPGVLVPQACSGSASKTKAAYRFFDNIQVDMQTLLRGHVEATAGRIQAHDVVLAVQDTTTLNYTAHASMAGIGPINTQQDSAVGLIVHDTLALSVEGTPLGLLDVQCWARDAKEAGKRERRKQLPIEQKESYKWLKSYRAVGDVQKLCPHSLLVSVGDREADLYELFLEAEKSESGPQLLVRAARNRQRKVEHAYLWERLATEPLAGVQELRIPRKGSRPERLAKLQVRYAQVTLEPPRGKQEPPVTLSVVYAREVDHAPEVKSPLEWMLLTTVEVNDFEQASERLRWYALRWGIEVYHRTLKSGCRIEDRRLETADRLEACLAIDMVVAWRIYWLTKQGRETPDIPCDQFLSEAEWKALCAYAHDAPPPQEPPTLREAVRMIAALGGFLGRRSDGEPGTTALWRGLQRLEDIAIGFALASSLQRQRDGP